MLEACILDEVYFKFSTFRVLDHQNVFNRAAVSCRSGWMASRTRAGIRFDYYESLGLCMTTKGCDLTTEGREARWEREEIAN